MGPPCLLEFPTLIPQEKKIAGSTLTKFKIFGQCWQQSCKKAAEECQNKENKHSWLSSPALEIIKSFLILIWL